MNLLDLLAGLACGVLSGCGIGGGSLLLIWMTQVSGLGQAAAQGINLAYFLPTSAAALASHWKNGLVEKGVLLWAAAPGALCSVLAAVAATATDQALLRRVFGIFCVIVGVKMLFGK